MWGLTDEATLRAARELVRDFGPLLASLTAVSLAVRQGRRDRAKSLRDRRERIKLTWSLTVRMLSILRAARENITARRSPWFNPAALEGLRLGLSASDLQTLGKADLVSILLNVQGVASLCTNVTYSTFNESALIIPVETNIQTVERLLTRIEEIAIRDSSMLTRVNHWAHRRLGRPSPKFWVHKGK